MNLRLFFKKKKGDFKVNHEYEDVKNQSIQKIDADLEETMTRVDCLEELIQANSFTKIMLVKPGKAEKEKNDGCSPCDVCC